MARALKVKATAWKTNDTAGVSNVVITLKHEDSGEEYTTTLPYREGSRDVDDLLSAVFKFESWIIFGDKDPIKGKYAAYIPEKDELRSLGDVFFFEDYLKGTVEKDYSSTSEREKAYVSYYKCIRG